MKKTRSPLAYVYLSLFIITSTAIIIFASLSGEVSSEQSSTLFKYRCENYYNFQNQFVANSIRWSPPLYSKGNRSLWNFST